MVELVQCGARNVQPELVEEMWLLFHSRFPNIQTIHISGEQDCSSVLMQRFSKEMELGNIEALSLLLLQSNPYMQRQQGIRNTHEMLVLQT